MSTVTEQSARDPSGAGPFFAIFVFPFLMLNEWRTFARAMGAPSLASGPKFNTTC